MFFTSLLSRPKVTNSFRSIGGIFSSINRRKNYYHLEHATKLEDDKKVDALGVEFKRVVTSSKRNFYIPIVNDLLKIPKYKLPEGATIPSVTDNSFYMLYNVYENKNKNNGQFLKLVKKDEAHLMLKYLKSEQKKYELETFFSSGRNFSEELSCDEIWLREVDFYRKKLENEIGSDELQSTSDEKMDILGKAFVMVYALPLIPIVLIIGCGLLLVLGFLSYFSMIAILVLCCSGIMFVLRDLTPNVIKEFYEENIKYFQLN